MAQKFVNNLEAPELHLSKHAQDRARQRGVTSDSIRLVYDQGDVEIPARRRCVQRTLSRIRQIELISDGCCVQDVDAAGRLVLLVSSEEEVITLYRRKPSPRRHFTVAVRHARIWRFAHV